MGESLNSKEMDTYIYEYSCAMLNLSNELTHIIYEWVRQNIPEKNLYVNEDNGIEGYEDTPHVTVKYGLHDEVCNVPWRHKIIKDTPDEVCCEFSVDVVYVQFSFHDRPNVSDIASGGPRPDVSLKGRRGGTH